MELTTEIKYKTDYDTKKIGDNISAGIKSGLKNSEYIPETLGEMLKWSGSYYAIGRALDAHSRNATENYMIIGCLLDKAERQQIHKHDGTNAKNFFNWCENERHIKRTKAQRMLKVFRTFKKRLEDNYDLILGVDPTKLALIAPYIDKMTNEEDIIEMIHSAADNSYRAIEANLAEMSGKVAQDMCAHINSEIWYRCEDCGKFFRRED